MHEAKRTPIYVIWIVGLVLVACGRPPLTTPSMPDTVADPVIENVESVIFYLGDPGEAQFPSSPVLAEVTRDIERWAEQAPPGAEVILVIPGDIIYPRGLPDRSDPNYEEYASVAMSQVRLVLGPAAMERQVPAYFMAGNHDWGLRAEWEGYLRLVNLDEFLQEARANTGANVSLVPEAGTGGPFVLDVGENLRLLILDTAWWLLEGSSPEQRSVLDGIDEAMATAGDRQIALVGHHPFRSGGPHGGEFSFRETLGLRYVLMRSGAILQDLTSAPYRDFTRGLREIFGRHGPPLYFMGGHEHSLQVIVGTEPTDPRFSLVSGSGSKLSGVGREDGLVFAQSSPGYMRIVTERNGRVTLRVRATDPDYLHCPVEGPERDTCMVEGLAAFETVFAAQLN